MLKISQDLPEWNHSIKLRELQIRVIFYKKKKAIKLK